MPPIARSSSPVRASGAPTLNWHCRSPRSAARNSSKLATCRSAIRLTTCPRFAAPSVSRTQPGSSARRASTCSTFAVSARSARWCCQNGRRHVGGDVLSSGVTPDVNTMPTDLIERVDIVTGGNSAVYGSDAIAGVVNFILKQDYEGIQLRGQGGASRYGDAGAYFIAGLAGHQLRRRARQCRRQHRICPPGKYLGRRSRQFLARRAADRRFRSCGGTRRQPRPVFFRNFRSATLNNTGNIRFRQWGQPAAPIRPARTTYAPSSS